MGAVPGVVIRGLLVHAQRHRRAAPAVAADADEIRALGAGRMAKPEFPEPAAARDLADAGAVRRLVARAEAALDKGCHAAVAAAYESRPSAPCRNPRPRRTAPGGRSDSQAIAPFPAASRFGPGRRLRRSVRPAEPRRAGMRALF